jgi:hypothetical protein
MGRWAGVDMYRNVCVCIYACVRVCLFSSFFVRVFASICMHVCTCVYLSLCVRVCLGGSAAGAAMIPPPPVVEHIVPAYMPLAPIDLTAGLPLDARITITLAPVHATSAFVYAVDVSVSGTSAPVTRFMSDLAGPIPLRVSLPPGWHALPRDHAMLLLQLRSFSPLGVSDPSLPYMLPVPVHLGMHAPAPAHECELTLYFWGGCRRSGSSGAEHGGAGAGCVGDPARHARCCTRAADCGRPCVCACGRECGGVSGFGGGYCGGDSGGGCRPAS